MSSQQTETSKLIKYQQEITTTFWKFRNLFEEIYGLIKQISKIFMIL